MPNEKDDRSLQAKSSCISSPFILIIYPEHLPYKTRKGKLPQWKLILGDVSMEVRICGIRSGRLGSEHVGRARVRAPAVAWRWYLQYGCVVAFLKYLLGIFIPKFGEMDSNFDLRIYFSEGLVKNHQPVWVCIFFRVTNFKYWEVRLWGNRPPRNTPRNRPLRQTFQNSGKSSSTGVPNKAISLVVTVTVWGVDQIYTLALLGTNTSLPSRHFWVARLMAYVSSWSTHLEYHVLECFTWTSWTKICLLMIVQDLEIQIGRCP